MVKGILAHRQFDDANLSDVDQSIQPDLPSYTTVALSDIIKNNHRVDASAFDIESKISRQQVEESVYGYVDLWGNSGIIKDAQYPGRFKRTYTNKKDGIAFYLPSQITDIYPKPTKYLSELNYAELEDNIIKPNSLLLTRSGTIGKCTISSNANIGKLYSDDVIRISFKMKYDLGYCYTFFCSKVGQSILRSNNYGAVVSHIEPEHLRNIIIPNAPSTLKERINNHIMTSFDLRDQSNRLIDKAETILCEELKLPDIDEIKRYNFDDSEEVDNYSIKLSELGFRFECSYHDPITKSIFKILNKNAYRMLPLGSPEISKEIYTGNRFTRIYVDEKNGRAYLNGKQITELDPNGVDKKYLSFSQHEEQIRAQLEIFENDILITCSGTIGKIVLCPKHWEGWVGTHDLIRLRTQNSDLIGYIFCFLNSDYGQRILKAQSYGAVVDHIEAVHVAEIRLPLLKDAAKQKYINDLVLESNRLRYRAYLEEQEAIKIFNEKVLVAQ